MKKAANNQAEDILKIVYFHICFKFLKNICENSSSFSVVTRFKLATLLKQNSDKGIYLLKILTTDLTRHF